MESFFILISKQLFFQDSSSGVNRDNVCQLPPQASHPPINCCKIEETCIWYEWCTSTMVEFSWQRTTQLWYDSHTKRSMLFTWLYSLQWRGQSWEHWIQESTAQHNGTEDAFAESRERIRNGSCIWKDAGSHSWKSSYREICGKNHQSICGWSLWNKWKRHGTTRFDQTQKKIFKLVQKIGMMCPSQDKEFVGHKIPKTGRALKSVKTRPLMSWRKYPVERNTKEDLHCTLFNAHNVRKALLGQRHWLPEWDTVPMLPHIFQLCFDGSFSNNWRCQVSHQFGGTDQVTASEASMLPLTGPLRILGFLDASHRNNDDDTSQWGMTVFLAESRERSSKDGMSYVSLIDCESQKIKKTVLSTAVAELYSFVKCFGSCQFLRGLWVDISGEVANIYMRTDAKNPVTTARTIHLLEQKGTIHMIFHVAKGSLFRKYSWFCSHSNPKLFGRLPHEGFSQGGQSDHSCADRNIDWCWHSPSF